MMSILYLVLAYRVVYMHYKSDNKNKQKSVPWYKNIFYCFNKN